MQMCSSYTVTIFNTVILNEEKGMKFNISRNGNIVIDDGIL